MNRKILFVAVVFLLLNCEAIFVENISDQTVILLAPTDTSEVSSGTIQFNWEEVLEATEYEIQIATPNFSGASQVLVDSLSASSIFSKELEAGEYQWRVKAVNSEYSSSYTTNSFSVIDTSFTSKSVQLILPSDKDTTNIKTHFLTWLELEGAIAYRVQVWQPDASGVQLLDQAIPTTSYAYEFPEGDFTWQVRGETSSKNTAFSARMLTVDATIPNTPSLDVPADNSSSTVNTSINFTWNRADITGTPERDSIYFYSEVNLQTLVHKNIGASKQYTKNDFSAGAYYWFVKAFDTAGNESQSSVIRKLTVN